MRLFILLVAMLLVSGATAQNEPADPPDPTTGPVPPGEKAVPGREALRLARAVLETTEKNLDTLQRLGRIARRGGPCTQSLRAAQKLMKKETARWSKRMAQINAQRAKVSTLDHEAAWAELDDEFVAQHERAESIMFPVGDSMAAYRKRCPKQVQAFGKAMSSFVSNM